MIEMFAAPDLETVDRELKVIEQGRKDGKEGRPSQSETVVSKAEEGIKAHIIKEVVKTQTLAQNAINDEVTQRSKMVAGEPIQSIRILSSVLDADTDSIEDKNEGRLVAKYQDRVKSEADSNYFRAENELTQDADYPTSAIMHYVIIGFIVLVETLLNSAFFAQGMEQGLVGGFIAALLITLVNVAAAFIVGTYCIRQINHIKNKKKIIGWITLFMYVVFLVWFCIAVGHFRSLIQVSGDAIEAARQIADVIFTWELVGIQEFYGWLLVFLSIFIGIITTIKFYYADDVYPGYGKNIRRMKSAAVAYEGDKNTHRNEVNLRLEGAQEELFRLKKQTHDHVKLYIASTKKSGHIIDGYLQYQESMQGLYASLIQRYRKANEQIRATEAPAFFSHVEKIETNYLPVLDQDRYKEDVKTIPDIEATLDELPEAFDKASIDLGLRRENNQKRFKDYILNTIELKTSNS